MEQERSRPRQLFDAKTEQYIKNQALLAANGKGGCSCDGFAPPFQPNVLGFGGYQDFETKEEAYQAAKVMKQYFESSAPIYLNQRQVWTIYSRVSLSDPYFGGTNPRNIPIPDDDEF